jgi:hypothetical protein
LTKLEHDTRFLVATADPADHLGGAFVEGLAEPAQVAFELHPRSRRDLLDGVYLLGANRPRVLPNTCAVQPIIWNRHGRGVGSDRDRLERSRQL